ncbi:MAG: hypothetical protein LBT46_15515 [Planctomycetaceae bacterium]|nr:hypothetical protein [Planctomycetaceae bacterium]
MKLCALAKKTGLPCESGKSLQITCEHSVTGCLKDCENCEHFSLNAPPLPPPAPKREYSAYGPTTPSYRAVSSYNVFGAANRPAGGGCGGCGQH